MARTIHIAKTEVEDFITVDSGQGKIMLTMFHGKLHAGTPGWAEFMLLTPEQAREVAARLCWRLPTIYS